MSNKKHFGIIPPVVTPIFEDCSFDEKGFIKLLTNLYNEGVHGLFTMGTCGEATVLPLSIWEQVHRTALDFSKGKMPLICGAIESSTLRVIELIHKLEDMGAQTAVVTTPYYQKSSEDQVLRHFDTICRESSIDIFVYNIPQFTETNISASLMREIIKYDNIAGIKDSGGNFAQILEFIALCKETNIAVFCGDEQLIGPAVLLGADGGVPGMANYFVKQYVDLYDAAKQGNIEQMFRLQLDLMQIQKCKQYSDSWVGAIKYIGKLKGIHEEFAAIPAARLTDEEKEQIERILSLYAS